MSQCRSRHASTRSYRPASAEPLFGPTSLEGSPACYSSCLYQLRRRARKVAPYTKFVDEDNARCPMWYSLISRSAALVDSSGVSGPWTPTTKRPPRGFQRGSARRVPRPGIQGTVTDQREAFDPLTLEILEEQIGRARSHRVERRRLACEHEPQKTRARCRSRRSCSNLFL